MTPEARKRRLRSAKKHAEKLQVVLMDEILTLRKLVRAIEKELEET